MVIQSVFRQFLCRRKYINIVHSATTIQKLARGNAVRDEIQRQESAALVIQKAWGNLVNQWSIDWAATCIQKLWRGAMVRQDLDQMLLEEEAACIIQKSWRGFCQFVNYEIALESTIVIQKVFRGFSVRKELEIHELKGAAIVIQSAWRGFAAQVQFNLDLFDIISVQTFVRRQIATKHYLDLIETVAVLQGAVRCWLARQKLQIKKKETIAAIVCQVSLFYRNSKNEYIWFLTIIFFSSVCHSMLAFESQDLSSPTAEWQRKHHSKPLEKVC
jgi:myosin heavy subunit